MARILITGATGFIGTALSLYLQQQGHELRGAVRRPVPQGIPYEAVPVGNLHAGTPWSGALEGIEIVIHLAARIQPPDHAENDPLEAFRRVNVEATAALARQAAEAGVQRFIHLSTVKVHGETNPPDQMIREEAPLAPADAYAVSKAEAEAVLHTIAQETGLETVILRPPLVYGPGVGGNLARLMQWIQRGLPLPLGAVTENRRSLVALDNLVHLIALCVDHPAAAHQTFLVADAQALSTADLLRVMGKAVGRPARLLPVPVPILRTAAALLGQTDKARRLLDSLQVDTSKVRHMLGWRPQLALEDGLRQMDTRRL